MLQKQLHSPSGGSRSNFLEDTLIPLVWIIIYRFAVSQNVLHSPTKVETGVSTGLRSSRNGVFMFCRPPHPPPPCVFVYGLPRPREFNAVVSGHKGHIFLIVERMCPRMSFCPPAQHTHTHTHVHTRAHDLSVLHPPADPDVLHKLPAEGRAAFWQGATKAR